MGTTNERTMKTQLDHESGPHGCSEGCPACAAETIRCRKCGQPIDPLDVFPGKICLTCHAKAFDEQVARNGGVLPRPNFANAIKL